VPRVVPENRREQKSPQGQTTAEEVGTPGPFLLSLRLPLKALLFEPFLRKNSGKTAEPRMHRGGTDPLLKYNVQMVEPELAAVGGSAPECRVYFYYDILKA
jgi:hypothetical protein